MVLTCCTGKENSESFTLGSAVGKRAKVQQMHTTRLMSTKHPKHPGHSHESSEEMNERGSYSVGYDFGMPTNLSGSVVPYSLERHHDAQGVFSLVGHIHTTQHKRILLL
jgi:hypothetical protein